MSDKEFKEWFEENYDLLRSYTSTLSTPSPIFEIAKVAWQAALSKYIVNLKELITWYFECQTIKDWHFIRDDLECIWTEDSYCPYCQALDEIDESLKQAEKILREAIGKPKRLAGEMVTWSIP